MRDTPQDEPGWTAETLRIHLTALMDRDKEAAREAVRIALEAVKDRQDSAGRHSTLTALMVSTLVAVLTLGFEAVMFFFHK
jgi:hypothetical protein